MRQSLGFSFISPCSHSFQCDYPQSNGRHHLMDSVERYKANSLAFRPESAPTVLDMSPDGSLSGPPSVRTSDLGDMHRGQFSVKKYFQVKLVAGARIPNIFDSETWRFWYRSLKRKWKLVVCWNIPSVKMSLKWKQLADMLTLPFKILSNNGAMAQYRCSQGG